MALEGVFWRTGLAVENARCVVTTSSGHEGGGAWGELSCENGFAVTRNGGGASRDRADFEDCLWCSGDVLDLLGGDETGLQKSLVDVGWESGGNEVGCYLASKLLWDWEGESIWNVFAGVVALEGIEEKLEVLWVGVLDWDNNWSGADWETSCLIEELNAQASCIGRDRLDGLLLGGLLRLLEALPLIWRRKDGRHGEGGFADYPW